MDGAVETVAESWEAIRVREGGEGGEIVDEVRTAADGLFACAPGGEDGTSRPAASLSA